MLAGLRRRATTGSRTVGVDSPDDGFTLIEMVVAISIVGVVMAALTTFFANSLGVVGQQRGAQAAIQLATGAADRVRALRGSMVATSRDRQSTEQQWAARPAALQSHLNDMQLTWDTAAANGAGATASLPTAAEPVEVNGVRYARSWYVGKCWQAPAGGDCTAGSVAGHAEFFRVVIAVQWTDKRCTTGTCTHATSMLVSGAAGEPIFTKNATARPPAVENPGAQTRDAGGEVTIALKATGGAPPVTWTGSGLPAGLVVNPSGRIEGTPATTDTKPRDHTVTIEATDGFGLVGSAEFTLTIIPAPRLTAPGDQVTPIENKVELRIPVTGGTGPFTWTADDDKGKDTLPKGLTIDAQTGVISGRPFPTQPAKPVTITAVSKHGAKASTTFDWTISSLDLPNPGDRTDAVGDEIDLTMDGKGRDKLKGGTNPYRWSAENLPPGLRIDAATGDITGTLTEGTRFITTVTVTDADAVRDSVTFVWNVTGGAGGLSGGLRVIVPDGDRTDKVGDSVLLDQEARGGIVYLWDDKGLPPGLKRTIGRITGKPTEPGEYPVELTVRSTIGFRTHTATYMFLWTIK